MSKTETSTSVIELAQQSQNMIELREKIANTLNFPQVLRPLGAGNHRTIFPLPNGLVLKSSFRVYVPEHDGQSLCSRLQQHHGTLDSNGIEANIWALYPELRPYMPRHFGWHCSESWIPHTYKAIVGQWQSREPIAGVNVAIVEQVQQMPDDSKKWRPELLDTAQKLSHVFTSVRPEEYGITADGRLVVLDAGCGLRFPTREDVFREALRQGGGWFAALIASLVPACYELELPDGAKLRPAHA